MIVEPFSGAWFLVGLLWSCLVYTVTRGFVHLYRILKTPKITVTQFKEEEMSPKQIEIGVLIKAFHFRHALCNRVLTSTNMILAYKNLEDIFIWYYTNAKVSVDENKVVKFDKMKNLALGNKNINERRVAFNKSIEMMNNILNGDLLK